MTVQNFTTLAYFFIFFNYFWLFYGGRRERGERGICYIKKKSNNYLQKIYRGCCLLFVKNVDFYADTKFSTKKTKSSIESFAKLYKI